MRDSVVSQLLILSLLLYLSLSLSCSSPCDRWSSPSFQIEQQLFSVEVDGEKSKEFFEVDTSYSQLPLRFVAEEGWDSYHWVIKAVDRDLEMVEYMGREFVDNTFEAPVDEYQDYLVQLTTEKQLDDLSCGINGLVEGYAERKISLVNNSLWPTTLRGKYEGYHKGARNRPFTLEIDAEIVLLGGGTPLTQWYVKGIPESCQRELFGITIGYDDFVIQSSEGWDFGCGGVKGWGELEENQLTFHYEFTPAGESSTESHIFIGQKIIE